jgi:ABC-type histidine transport system ATPase subunit
MLDPTTALAEPGMMMLVVTTRWVLLSMPATARRFFEGGRIAEFGPPHQVLTAPQAERVRQFRRAAPLAADA